MTINFMQFSAASATDGVLVAVDTMTVGTATGVEVQLIKFGFGTDEVYTQVASGVGLPIATGATYPVAVATGVGVTTYTATGQVLTSALSTATQPVAVGTWTATGQVLVSALSTATMPVSIAGSVAVTVATEIILATGDTIDVAVATEIKLATDNVIDVSLATTTVTQTTATNLNAIVQISVPRSNVSSVFQSATGTDSTTLVTATANAHKDLVAIHVVNGGTAALGIIIESASTVTEWHHELAAEGGGFAMNFPIAIPQEQQATNWTFELDTDTSASNPVSVFAQFVTVT